jgi:aminopeptidase N
MQAFSRLTETFTPSNYELSITLEREERKFSGVVTIHGELLKGDYIPLHAKDLTINTITLDGKNAEFTSADNDELRIINHNLENNQHVIVIDFEGTITDAMHGLYPCYFEIDGKKQELLATQFESHHAREVFPCVDEPAAKATFDLTITSEKDVTVLGNMPVKNQHEENDKLITTFETTPKMSSYLLAWVVGDLQKKTATTKSGVEVNVWSTRVHDPSSLDFALEVSTKCIDFYNEYFDTDYPLPKCDHVALPDFSSGAMENWGLITYREMALLASKSTSISAKRYIATVICHELSHQWFGNLVTMQWWNDLWLNESFATIMEYIAVDALYPDWEIWREFASNESIAALRRDALDGVQSVHVEVRHPDEISTLFDGAIVYAKGARLMRMMQRYVGEDAFQAGLKSYFKKYAYANTVGQNLWDELSRASGKDISKLMNTWVSQSGYPVVSVEKSENKLRLSQEQFFIGPHSPSEKIWPIPLNSSVSELPELLEERSLELSLPQDIVRLNDEDSAHFITKYNREDALQIASLVSQDAVSDITKLQFLHEQTLLAKAGAISAAELIPLLDAYKNTSSEPVWGIISLAIGELRQLAEGDDESESRLKNFVRELVRREYNRLGWKPKEDESEDDTTLRSTILGLAIYSENRQAIDTAHTIFDIDTLSDIDPELRGIVIANEIKHFDTSGIVLTRLLEVYAKTHDNDVKRDICNGLTTTKNSDNVDTLLAAIKDTSIIRSQDVFRWFAYLVRGRYSRSQAWQWMQDNWDWIETNFAGDKSLDDFPRYAANGLRTKQQYQEFSSFFSPFKTNPALVRAITIGEGEIEGRIAYIEREAPRVAAELKK